MDNEKLPSYGGQAIIEGVMMRGSQAVAAAMRNPEGEIIVKVEELSGIYKSSLRNIPLLRGLIILWDALGLGTRYLTISANLQTGEDEKIEGPALYLTLFTSFAIAIALFFLAPAALGQLAQNTLQINAWWGNIVEGVVRLLLLILYMWGIGQMEDIRRVFGYHGAEHKTINAFEAGVELTPENVSKFSVEHPRCGTAFLLTLMIISILIFSLFGPMPLLWRLISRILLLPLIAGLSYEYIRWSGNHLDSKFVQMLIRPNLSLQSLTTREPSKEMLEVAIASFNAMFERETLLSQQQSLNAKTIEQPASIS